MYTATINAPSLNSCLEYIIKVLTFSVCCDIILVAGSEGKAFDRNVMPDKTAS